jgi:hypothetical protein
MSGSQLFFFFGLPLLIAIVGVIVGESFRGSKVKDGGRDGSVKSAAEMVGGGKPGDHLWEPSEDAAYLEDNNAADEKVEVSARVISLMELLRLQFQNEEKKRRGVL